MPFGWGESSEVHEQVYQDKHEGKLSHELVAGAASFEAFKKFEDHQRNEGKPVSHAFAKEFLVGIAGAEVDKLVETKGLDYVDREKAKYHAKQNAEHLYEEHYERGQGADQYDPNQYGPPDFRY